jgi:hypothetical protein
MVSVRRLEAASTTFARCDQLDLVSHGPWPVSPELAITLPAAMGIVLTRRASTNAAARLVRQDRPQGGLGTRRALNPRVGRQAKNAGEWEPVRREAVPHRSWRPTCNVLPKKGLEGMG